MSYSQFFNTELPSLEEISRREVRFQNYGYGTPAYGTLTRTVVNPGEQIDLSAIDKMLDGLDADSDAYVETLKGIYDNFQGYVDEYGENIEPVLSALDGDIERMFSGIDDYKDTLNEMKPTFMDGIQVDPTASRTRAEYMGATADQFGSAEDALQREMTGQGMNYYANKGAGRELKLRRASGLSTASNKAYDDWRAQHNNDVKAKQAGMATYADLESRASSMEGQAVNARAGMAGFHRSVLDSRLSAEDRRASGYEGLLGLTERRRTEALELAQHAGNINMQAQNMGAQLDQNNINSGNSDWSWS